jgi:hypothetical protein
MPEELTQSSFPSYKDSKRGRIPNSSTTTRSTKAVTLRHGNSRNSIQKRSVRASDLCAVDHLARFGLHLTIVTYLFASTRRPYSSSSPRCFCFLNPKMVSNMIHKRPALGSHSINIPDSIRPRPYVTLVNKNEQECTA